MQYIPKVSVIIPVYGVEKYIERCAQSLFEQTISDAEYIFIDDCSPDCSIEILNRVINKYRHRIEEKNYVVRIEKMSMNSGLHAVRQYGIQFATGEYIIHCDSDDWVDIEMYQAMYEKAKHDNSDLVICDYVISDGALKRIVVNGCHSVSMDMLIHNSLFQKDSWSVWNKLFRRNAYYNIKYPTRAMGEDMLITIQLILNCQNFSYIPVGYYYYFENFNSISKSRGVDASIFRFDQAKENVEKLIRIFEEKGLSHKYRWEINYLQYTVMRLIQSVLDDNRCMNLWKNTYPGIGLKFIFNPYVPIKDKVKFILSSFKLYPFKHVIR